MSTASAQVLQLKEALTDLRHRNAKLEDQLYLYYWLKYCKMDLRKAEEAIRANMKWRDENNIHALETEELCPDLVSVLPIIFELKSKDGFPAIYCLPSALLIPPIWKKFGKEQVFRHLAHVYVKMEQFLLKNSIKESQGLEAILSGKVDPRYKCIFDAEGFGLGHTTCLKTVQFYLEWTKLYVNHFPHVVPSPRIINANKFTEIVLPLIKPLLASKGFELKVHGTDQSKWKEDIFSVLDAETIKGLRVRSKAALAVNKE